jgi:hypothetical protein
MLRRNLLSASFRLPVFLGWMRQALPKRRYTSTNQHGVTSQKAIILMHITFQKSTWGANVWSLRVIRIFTGCHSVASFVHCKKESILHLFEGSVLIFVSDSRSYVIQQSNIQINQTSQMHQSLRFIARRPATTGPTTTNDAATTTFQR